MAVTWAEYKRYLKKVRPRQRMAAIRGLHSAAARAVQIIVTEIIPSRTPQPVDRGLYRAGWRFVPEQDGALIENVEPHAAFIEYGVRSANVKIGRAMITALSEWIVRKRIVSASEPKEVLRAAWAIAKAMKRRGIFGKGMRVLEELVVMRLDAVVAEEIAREVGKELADKKK